MRKQKSVAWPKQLMGKHCGYLLYEDGSIQIAETHAALMKTAISDEAGLLELVQATNDHIAKQYARTANIRMQFWKAIGEDYGLDYNAFEYSYDPYQNKVMRLPKRQKEKP